MNSGPTIPLRFAATTADPGERLDHFLSCDSATGSDADRLRNTSTKFAAAGSDLGAGSQGFSSFAIRESGGRSSSGRAFSRLLGRPD